MTLGATQRIAKALDADMELTLRWRGGWLDRLLDERHAGLVGATADRLGADGWKVQLEVTYSHFGERGSIDLLAFERRTRTLLVGEVKSEIGTAEGTVRKHDEKARLAPRTARERFGWVAQRTARILVLPADSTPRRQVERHAAVFDRAYPLRGRALLAWLRDPSGPANSSAQTGSISGLLFTSGIRATTARRHRVSVRGACRGTERRAEHDDLAVGPGGTADRGRRAAEQSLRE